MGALLGPQGGLLELACSSQLQPAPVTPRHSYATSLSGRVRAQRALGHPKRTWDVAVSTATPAEYAALRQLERGLWGAGPWFWFDEYAQVVNMLTPGETHMYGWSTGTVGGTVTTQDGTQLFRTLNLSTGSQAPELSTPLPIPGGRVVTASAYVTAQPGATVTLAVDEIDAAGTVTNTVRRASGANAVGQRVAATFTTQPGTVALRPRLSGAAMIGGPAITLTKTATPWSDGRGCRRAVIELPGEDVQLAIPDTPWGVRAGYSMTVMEVG